MTQAIQPHSEWGDFHVLDRKTKRVNGKRLRRYRCQCTYYANGCVKWLKGSELANKPLCDRNEACGQETKTAQAIPLHTTANGATTALVPAADANVLSPFKELPTAGLTETTQRKMSANYDFMHNQMDTIKGLLAELQSNTDVNSVFATTTVNMLLNLLPVAENEYRRRPTQSYAYAMNSYIAQIRELMSDLDSSHSQTENIFNLFRTIMRECIMDIGRVIIDGHYDVQKAVKNIVGDEQYDDVKERVDNITLRMGERCQDAMDKAMDKLAKNLVGDEHNGS